MTPANTTVGAAREALDRHAWSEAFTLLKQADVGGGLDADALDTLAEAAWWTAQPTEITAARERAYGAHLAKGDAVAAARSALWLARDNGTRGADAVARAWLARAERLLEKHPDSVPAGYAIFIKEMLGDHRDPDRQIVAARRAAEIGRANNDADLQAFGLMMEGEALVGKGEVAAGMALYDEATVAAVAGELSPWTTGLIYCATISACRDIGDFRRASDWTEATTRWCERQSISGFPGICRVHRAEVLALRGAWANAEQEARRACDELERYGIGVVLAQGLYEIGLIRLRMGDLSAAEDAFKQAHATGMVPEPGLSLLRLAHGDPQAAAHSLGRALADETTRTARARLLPALVEISIAAGDLPKARAASAELDEIAVAFATTAMQALADHARGTVQLAEGDPKSAESTLRNAIRLWQSINAPYEVARSRLELFPTLRAQGDEATARLELEAARETFERLGARLDARRTAELLGSTGSVSAVVAERATKTFVFTDIVRSTKLVEAIGDEAWQDLIRWHDATLRSLIAEHRGEEVRHQGDGFVVTFDSPANAIECAVAVQRRLAEHRRQHGFAPQVRIGMHTAPADRRGLDYAGYGIHEAARIAGAAGANEIVASAATFDAAGTTYSASKRTVELKDLPGPVEIASIDWR